MDSINLTWFGPQSIKGLKYSDKIMDLDVEKIISNMSLYSFYKTFSSTSKKIPFFAHTEITNADIKFHSPNYPPAAFYNVNAQIESKNRDVSSITLNGKSQADSDAGMFNANLEIGKFNTETEIQCNNLPVIILDQLLFYSNPQYQGSLFQILGPKMNLHVTAKLTNNEGPVDIDLASTNCNAAINLNYMKDKITLNSPALITLHLRNSLQLESLKRASPIFASGISANNPIVLRISNDSFVLPINPFNLKKAYVKHAMLDLGKIWVENSGAISTIASIAKQGSGGKTSIWFTYVNLKLENGILYSDRMDELLNDSIHVCTWGNINLLSKEINMILGICADTLRRAYGLQNLSSDYVITVPIRGTLDNIKIDASAATAKIIGLSAMKQIGGGLGSIVGGVLTHIDNDNDIPEPKTPFPWGSIDKGSQKNREKPNIFELFK